MLSIKFSVGHALNAGDPVYSFKEHSGNRTTITSVFGWSATPFAGIGGSAGAYALDSNSTIKYNKHASLNNDFQAASVGAAAGAEFKKSGDSTVASIGAHLIQDSLNVNFKIGGVSVTIGGSASIGLGMSGHAAIDGHHMSFGAKLERGLGVGGNLDISW